MKKIIVFISIIILGLSLFFLRDTFHFYYGKYLFEKWNFSLALEQFDKISQRDIASYNKWNTLAQMWFWEKWEEKQQTLWHQALSEYKKSLEVKENSDTQYNYEVISQLLTEQQQSESEENQDEEFQENQDTQPEESEQENNSQSNQESWEQGEETTQNNPLNQRGEEYMLEESDTVQELSQDQIEELEQYIDSLEYQQQQNQKYFWKKPDLDSGDIFDSLFPNPFFDSNLWGTEEKDW